jgi:hypothetical protein
MNASERYKILNNIIGRVGIDGDIISELAKVESMINAIEQGKMMPPPVPPEITEPTMSQPPVSEESLPTESPMGKYDNL